MLFPSMHQLNSGNYIPQGLEPKKLARPMSGLKPGPTQFGSFSATLKSGLAELNRSGLEAQSFSMPYGPTKGTGGEVPHCKGFTYGLKPVPLQRRAFFRRDPWEPGWF